MIAPYFTPDPFSSLLNAFQTRVTPEIGSIVYCDLATYAEHSGVVVGDNSIVHLSGAGDIEVVTPKEFVARLGGFSNSKEIYVSCNGKEAVGHLLIGAQAAIKLEEKRDYNFIMDNCHQFTSGCITRDFENCDNFLWMLKHTASEEMGVNNWLPWDGWR